MVLAGHPRLKMTAVTAVPDTPKERALRRRLRSLLISAFSLLYYNVTEHAVIEMSANVANHQVSTGL